MPSTPRVEEADPFDLPDWLGTEEVMWRARSGIRDASHVRGELTGTGSLECDLLAADEAFPQPVLDEAWRRRAHQAWAHGQVLLVAYDGRLTLAVPGTGFTADRVLEALNRLAKAIAVSPDRFLAALRL